MWAREGQAHERMAQLVREHEKSSAGQAKLLQHKVAETVALLQTCARNGSGLTPYECEELAAMLRDGS